MFICVRHLLTAICLFVMGCYATPDYAATRFKCDTAHACPDGQACVNGLCSGGSSSAVGVSCGTITCPASQQCCLDFVSDPYCTAAPANCGGITAACDGIEDCGGNACCESFDTIVCRTTRQCQALDQDEICRDASDCTDPTAPQCCFNGGLPGEPWGRCGSSCK